MEFKRGDEYGQAMEYVKRYVPRRARLEQVAEEATELAQAALKLIRAEGTDNPTPTSRTEAKKHFWEEVADINNAISAIGWKSPEIQMEMEEMKMIRWAERIEEWNRQEGRKLKGGEWRIE